MHETDHPTSTPETLQRVPRSAAFKYDLLAEEAAIRVRPGERFVLETHDTFGGAIRSEADLPTDAFLAEYVPRLNPCAGPVHVEGAEPGDVLAVHVHDIVVADVGVTGIYAGSDPGGSDSNPLSDSVKYPDCRGPYTKIIHHLPGPSGTTSDGTAVFSETLSWPLAPHIGTIATAPLLPIAAGGDTIEAQGPFGGNLDSRDFAKGNTIYLPVMHAGGQLYAGDVHATMADTEFAGLADEAAADLTLSCEVLKGKRIPWVRVETPDAIIQLNARRPVEAAVRQAFFWLMEWLVDDYGFTPRDAYLQLGVNPDLRVHVYQMVPYGRLNYVVGAAFPKTSLPRG